MEGSILDHNLLHAQIDRIVSSGGGTLDVPDGIHFVSRTLELPINVSLRMAPGARLVASPDFQGDAIIRKLPVLDGVHHYNGCITGGILDGGKQNLTGIHAPGSCRMTISDIEIVNCLRKGVYVGSSDPTWGYEVNVRGVRCAIDLDTPHAPESIGLHYEQITDSFISQVVIIGYETGVASESASNDFSQVHVWSVTAHGPLKRNFYCNGWGDSYSQCYADAPFDEGRECFGFLVAKPFNRFVNCRVYCNTFTFDNTVVGFYLTESGTHGSYLNNLFTADKDRRIKAAFSGKLEAATILGNGYDPNIIGGRENRIASDTGGISYVPPLQISSEPLPASDRCAQ